MIRFSRLLSLGVVCILLFDTSAYGQIDCPAIKRNVDNILSIGPWQSSKVAIITTDLQLFEVTLPSDASPYLLTKHFELDSPSSLATSEPALYGALKQEHPTFTSRDTLIQVNSPAALQRYVLLSNSSGFSWLINPLNGESRRLGQAQFLSDGSTWCSSDSLTFYALNGKWIQMGACVLGKQPHIGVDAFVKYWEYEADSVKTVDQPSRRSPNWNVRKAFTYQKQFYLLTPETVYIFSDGEVFHPTVSVSYSKVPYESFFTCKEETKKGTKDQKSKEKVTHAHSVHSSSPRSSTKWLLIDIALGVVFLLLAGLGAFYLCRGKMTSKEGESKGSPSQREKPRRTQKRRKSTATFGQRSLVKGPKRSRASPSKVGPPSVASKLVAPKSSAQGLKKGSSSHQVGSNSKIASSWKTEGKLG